LNSFLHPYWRMTPFSRAFPSLHIGETHESHSPAFVLTHYRLHPPPNVQRGSSLTRPNLFVSQKNAFERKSFPVQLRTKRALARRSHDDVCVRPPVLAIAREAASDVTPGPGPACLHAIRERIRGNSEEWRWMWIVSRIENTQNKRFLLKKGYVTSKILGSGDLWTALATGKLRFAPLSPTLSYNRSSSSRGSTPKTMMKRNFAFAFAWFRPFPHE